jgi:hypothetical protein
VYRRTLVMVRARPLPYVVIRDQYAGPVSLNAAYCLHAYGNDISRRDRTFEFGKLAVFCAAPETFEVSRHDWKKYKTLGLRLTTSGASGTFITVLVPHPEPDAQTGATAALPAMSAIEGGVKVGDDEIRFDGGIDDEDAVTYVSVRTGGGDTLTLTGKDIDLNRSQGEIGLFVPDAGYPFGEIPNWLRLQRATVPDWAPDWARKLRSRRQ